MGLRVAMAYHWSVIIFWISCSTLSMLSSYGVGDNYILKNVTPQVFTVKLSSVSMKGRVNMKSKKKCTHGVSNVPRFRKTVPNGVISG